MIELPLTAEQFAAKARRLAEEGLPLPGPSGTLSKSGVKAAYEYAAGLLKVTILEKPFFLSTEHCEQQLRDWLVKH